MFQPQRARSRGADPIARRRGTPMTAVILLAALLTAGCSGAQADTGASRSAPGKPSATRTPPAGPSEAPSAGTCKEPPAADVPGAAGALSQTDSGTYCLALGRQIDVFLTAPGARRPGVTRWTSVATSAPHVLGMRSSGILTAPVGVTPAIFQALTPGIAQLTSNLPGTSLTWHVAILVR